MNLPQKLSVLIFFLKIGKKCVVLCPFLKIDGTTQE